ncbi:MAG: valine--tRNA ligase [Fimbriimonadales bacterium]|nr:MAG: valine--tRNA ligase [Fimbriimonadales bacterium]
MINEPTLSTKYDPTVVEERWYREWESQGLFRPEYRPNPQRRYCITIPPPNVTGSLHMGHALCYSIQDVLGRWKRMQGFETLILPGTDHAGIATQKVVESQLREEGLTRHDLGREKFLERVWKWKEESGGMILKQFKRLGFAFDWSRERFTMDPHYHDAVLRVFLDWYERGLIYRGKRVINWDPGLRTSVSDIEVSDEVRQGKLYHIRYPFVDGGGFLVVATTRPETMLADVAVAVHPSDKRYQHLVGKQLRLPLTGRTIPVIADEYPDPEFGTGAVKITPAHDANDFEVGVRMGLDFDDPEQVPVCIDEEARVVAPGTPYHGLDRWEARKRIVADLEREGLLEKVEDHEIALKIADRSGEVIEPLLSEQWFCSMKPLAEPAIRAVKEGRIRFTPARYTDVYLEWMENIRDWCLSRQLWWGHRIPIYYTEDGTPIAAMSEDEARQKAGGARVTQDPDVLDTWFSSALWPFATLGWPDQTEDLKRYYPTDVLVTARDIIYLWVARMIMDGLDQVQEIPFRDVYVYATVLTEDGKRMSKSLGTGVDPLEYINRFGADAMRFSLLVQTGMNQEIRFGDRPIQEARNFCNKIWNAARFALMHIGEEIPAEPSSDALALEDRWILDRLNETIEAVSDALQRYHMMDATKRLYDFFWSEFCDWYIEACKRRLEKPEGAVARWVLYQCLDRFCRLMHPFMPHITEEVWHRLPGIAKDSYLDYTDWPSPEPGWQNEEARREFERVQETVRAARNLRQEVGVSPKQRLEVLFAEGLAEGHEDLIAHLAGFERIEGGKPAGPYASTVSGSADLHLPLEGVVDVEAERKRLETLLAKRQKELESLDKRLSNPMFVERAKPEVVEADRLAAQGLREEIERLNRQLERLSALKSS